MDRNLLCPDLYDELERVFGRVRVGNPGEPLLADVDPDPATGREKWHVRQYGETYSVDCPYCHDTRQRLSISYCYGQVDASTGRAATWLAHCFNEGCTDGDAPGGYDNRRDLEDRIFGFVNRADRVGRFPVRQVVAEPQALGPVELPGTVVTLDNLPADHPAVRYVEGRGYDAAELGRTLGVGCCTDPDARHPAARGRVIIPIVVDGQLAGWQGRYPGDLDWRGNRGTPKYYNLPRMPKKLMLYNCDAAAAGRVVVLVEGVTSVWSIGPPGVAALGKTLSEEQRRRLVDTWARKGSLLVMIFDRDPVQPGKEDEAERAELKVAAYFADLAREFEFNGGAAVRIRMDPGKDPGDYSRDQVWRMIADCCRARGVNLSDYQ